MAERPCELHYYGRVARASGADVFPFYPENESVGEASEQPCRGGYRQRPIKRTEKPKDYDGCDRRQNKVPDVLSATVASKRVGASPTVLNILAEQ